MEPNPHSNLAKARVGLEVVVAAHWVRRALRTTDIRSVMERVRRGTGDADGPLPIADALWLGRAVTRTLALLPNDDKCLQRSAVLCVLLARRGTACSLVIGVRPGETFEAHAWVEVDGQPVLPAGAGVYAPLAYL